MTRLFGNNPAVVIRNHRRALEVIFFAQCMLYLIKLLVFYPLRSSFQTFRFQDDFINPFILVANSVPREVFAHPVLSVMVQQFLFRI